MTQEELQELTLTLQDQIEQLKIKQQQTEEDNNNKQNKINELSEINQKLFLRVTNPYTEDKKEQEHTEDKEYIDHVGQKLWDKLSTVDKDKLKIILEGEDE